MNMETSKLTAEGIIGEAVRIGAKMSGGEFPIEIFPNRKYQLRNGSIDLGFDLDSNPLLDMGKGYLDAAQDIYDKCKLKDTKLLKKQLTSDYKLYD